MPPSNLFGRNPVELSMGRALGEGLSSSAAGAGAGKAFGSALGPAGAIAGGLASLLKAPPKTMLSPNGLPEPPFPQAGQSNLMMPAQLQSVQAPNDQFQQELLQLLSGRR